MRRVRDYAAHAAQIHVFAMGEGGPAAELHVIESTDLQEARQGAGGVHHVAFFSRTPDEAHIMPGRSGSTNSTFRNSGEIDRFYFSKSVISASPTASCLRSHRRARLRHRRADENARRETGGAAVSRTARAQSKPAEAELGRAISVVGLRPD